MYYAISGPFYAKPGWGEKSTKGNKALKYITKNKHPLFYHLSPKSLVTGHRATRFLKGS